MTQNEQNYQAWMGWGAAAPSLPLPSLSPLPDLQSKTRGRKITVVSISRNLFLPSAKCTAAASASSSLFLLSSRCALPSLITSRSEEGRAASSWPREDRPTPCWWRQDMTRSDKRAADGNLAADGTLARQGTRHHSLHTSEHNKTLQPAVPFRQYTSKYLSGEKERRRKEKRGQRVREKTWSCEIWC